MTTNNIDEYWKEKAPENLALMFPDKTEWVKPKYQSSYRSKKSLVKVSKSELNIQSNGINSLASTAISIAVAGISASIIAELMANIDLYPDIFENDDRAICLKEWFK